MSLDKVIGRIFRNTRLQDTSYIRDMYDWIPEVMAILRTRHQVVNIWGDINISYFKGSLPSGLYSVDAMTYQGSRIRSSEGTYFMDAPPFDSPIDAQILQSTPGIQKNAVTGNNMYVGLFSDVDLIVPQWDGCSKERYWVTGRCINFTVSDCTVRIFGKKIATDAKGLPIIPEDEAYQEAIYWYVRKKIIETGYKDPVFKWGDCEAEYKIYAARAISAGLLNTTDEMDEIVNRVQWFSMPELF